MWVHGEIRDGAGSLVVAGKTQEALKREPGASHQHGLGFRV